jgi:hypothetical protein
MLTTTAAGLCRVGLHVGFAKELFVKSDPRACVNATFVLDASAIISKYVYWFSCSGSGFQKTVRPTDEVFVWDLMKENNSLKLSPPTAVCTRRAVKTPQLRTFSFDGVVPASGRTTGATTVRPANSTHGN